MLSARAVLEDASPSPAWMENVTPLLSLPHTGTRFTQRLLMKMPGVENHLSIYLSRSQVPELERTVLWGHYMPSFWPIPAKWGKTIIVPMRDPLAALISHTIRETKMFLGYWRMAVKDLSDEDVHYFPVDLDQDRFEACRGVARAAGFDNAEKECRAFLDEWEENKEGNSGPHPLKQMYAQGDKAGLKKALPWDRLCEYEPILRPWLENMGYSNLMWWD